VLRLEPLSAHAALGPGSPDLRPQAHSLPPACPCPGSSSPATDHFMHASTGSQEDLIRFDSSSLDYIHQRLIDRSPVKAMRAKHFITC
jgi:hypothetical protein